MSIEYNHLLSTDGKRILHALLVKHYNDLLDSQSSERGKDEVTYFYVGDVFCITNRVCKILLPSVDSKGLYSMLIL